MIYSASQKGPYKVSGYHDPDSIVPFQIVFRPTTWTANTVYTFVSSNEYSIVLPTVYKGYYYACVNGGKSGASEPTWALRKDEETTDFESGATDGLTWKAVPYNLLATDVNLSSVDITSTNGVTTSAESNTTTKVFFTIDSINSNASARALKYFDVLIRATYDSTAREDFTLRFKLAER